MDILKLFAREYSDGSVKIFKNTSENEDSLVAYYKPDSIWKPKRNVKYKSFGPTVAKEIVWLN